MKAKVMARAWEIARVGAAKFGGSVRMYLAEALRQAWAEAKDAPHFGYIEIGKKNGVLLFAVDHHEDLRAYLLSDSVDLMGRPTIRRKEIDHRLAVNKQTNRPARIYDVSVFGTKIEFVRGDRREIMTIDRGLVRWA